MLKKSGWLIIGLLGYIQLGYTLDLELTQGSKRALPIAVIPFSKEGDEISLTVQHDLKNSGAFKLITTRDNTHQPHNALQTDFSYWKSLGANNLVVGDVKSLPNGQLSVAFQLLDPIGKSHIMISREYTIPKPQLRALAHHISDIVYQQLTGDKGIFSTRLAYISVERDDPAHPRYTLEVSDYDGKAAKSLLVSNQPIMSPSWSPDGERLAYVSFENKKAEIYVVNAVTGERQLITSYPGINGAPSWSPDGKQLALVLSKSGAPNIYLYRFNDKSLQQLTNGTSIDTEPRFSPDGKTILFTSNRGGSPQLYRLTLSTQKIVRLTYDGNYNASGVYTPDQKGIVLLHRSANAFAIALQDLSSGVTSPISFGKHDQSPSLAPNGRMVVYATSLKGKGRLKIASIDGQVQLSLPQRKADLKEPAWSPFLN